MNNTDQHINPKEQLVQVALNDCYMMCYDKAKNRICFTIYGFWKNKECVSDFITDWQKALSISKPGFTCITDMRTMITHPQELSSLHIQAYKLLTDAGVKKVAHVMPTDKIAYLQVHSIYEKSSLPAKAFTNYEQADEWLDFITDTASN